MTTTDPRTKSKSWPSETFWDRVQKCRALLRIHGFLSEGENHKVEKRIREWVKKSGCEITQNSTVDSADKP